VWPFWVVKLGINLEVVHFCRQNHQKFKTLVVQHRTLKYFIFFSFRGDLAEKGFVLVVEKPISKFLRRSVTKRACSPSSFVVYWIDWVVFEWGDSFTDYGLGGVEAGAFCFPLLSHWRTILVYVCVCVLSCCWVLWFHYYWVSWAWTIWLYLWSKFICSD